MDQSDVDFMFEYLDDVIELACVRKGRSSVSKGVISELENTFYSKTLFNQLQNCLSEAEISIRDWGLNYNLDAPLNDDIFYVDLEGADSPFLWMLAVTYDLKIESIKDILTDSKPRTHVGFYPRNLGDFVRLIHEYSSFDLKWEKV